MDDPSLREELFELIARGRRGFNTFFAIIDLLGIRSMMKSRIDEAHVRLDDLHQGFGDALIFFPGGEDYRL